MMSLDAYLHGPHKDDGAFLDRLVNTIRDVVPIFYRQPAKLPLTEEPGAASIATWPYAVSLNDARAVQKSGTKFSASTHGMVLFALDAFIPRGRDRYSFLLGEGFKPSKVRLQKDARVSLRKAIKDAKTDLFEVALNQTDSDKRLAQSGTYGRDDPFTLTWLTELAFRCSDEDFDTTHLHAARRRICDAAERALRRDQILDLEGADGAFSEVTGSFLKVRRLHLAKSVQRLANETEFPLSRKEWHRETAVAHLWDEFDRTIHRQLSFFANQDPKFDPAELAFAFEGALLLQRYWVGRSTIDQVFDALTLTKSRQPFWRPITPFLINDRGQVLFLVSVEVANSILRACEILDRDEAIPARFAQIEPQLRTYATWLLGEIERLDPATGEGNLVGWRTEYADRGTIHLWHTSHVLLFLAHYESLLRRKIGADGIEAAGLHVRLPHTLKDLSDTYWADEPLSTLAVQGRRHYAVLRTIEDKYIKSRQGAMDNPNAPRSVMLYGPPGTGKTTLAEQLSVRLGCPLIVVTVSDFLAEGSAEIENRAKGVFEVLRSQQNVVILFDEIDQFLLDRNSEFYREQSDVFKFMTPGMLTKLQDLREAEGIIFMVATNYYERIDSAIKRRGRIDDHLLLCIPDAERRLLLIERFVRKFFEDRLARRPPKRLDSTAVSDDGPSGTLLDAIASKTVDMEALLNLMRKSRIPSRTVLFSYGDLAHLVESKAALDEHMDVKQVVAAIEEAAQPADAAVSLSAYRPRLEEGLPALEEFLLLVHLCAEIGKDLSVSDREAIGIAYGRVTAKSDGDGSDCWDTLTKDGHVKEKFILTSLRRYTHDIPIPVFKATKRTAN
jgi:hypothetical protein